MSKTTLTNPKTLYSRSDVLAKPCPVPQEPGVYAWFFKEVSAIVPTDGCVTKGDLTLLYVGISPDKASKPNSKQNLRKRITNHYRGNAKSSTLRRSLGVLLTDQSNFPLRRVGSGKQMTFTHHGEQWLDDWMENNAFVVWIEHPAPWELEEELLSTLSLPLNIKGNAGHLFAGELSQLRKDAIKQAKEQPVANEDNQQRQMPSAIGPCSKKELNREQVEQLFWDKYGKHLGSPTDPVFDLDRPDIKSWLRGPGNEIADWHFTAFAEIDDLIKSIPDDDKKVSIELVRKKWEKKKHAHKYDSFEAMYNEFKRDKELEYRRRRFAKQLLDGNKDEAIEHLFRLSLITDINSLFGSSE